MEGILLSRGYILEMTQREAPEEIKRGWVGITGNRVSMVTYDEVEADRFRGMFRSVDLNEIDCWRCVVMPGLINAHTHVSMTMMRNFADDRALMDWLENYIWPFEAMQSEEDIAAGARLGIAEMMLGGTTSFVDMYWSEGVIAECVRDLGCRALLCEAVVGGREESFRRNMDRLREVAVGCSRVMCGVGPHAPYSCTPETLRVARDYAVEHSLPVTIHLNETAGERAMMLERTGMTPMEYVESSGLFERPTVVAHGVDLTPEEMERLKSYESCVAHSPQSNMKLASGIASVTEMNERGVLCGIGTDGASSNNDLDMWDEMRTALLLQRVATGNAQALSPYDVLRMATCNGAVAMGLESELGRLEDGCLADVIVVDLGGAHIRPVHNILSALLFCVKGGDVRDVIVDGVVQVRNRNLLGSFVEGLCREVEGRSREIIERGKF